MRAGSGSHGYIDLAAAIGADILMGGSLAIEKNGIFSRRQGRSAEGLRGHREAQGDVS